MRSIKHRILKTANRIEKLLTKASLSKQQTRQLLKRVPKSQKNVG